MMIEFFNEDCMEVMARYPDNHFQLACTDPPYGIDDKLCNGSGFKRHSPSRLGYAEKRWDTKPELEYFVELQRVSKNQIIWGGNYFADMLPPSRGVIAWVKPQMRNHPNFSHFELAWTSFDKPAKCVYTYDPSENRTHPTQKAVKLYDWLLSNYAKEGDKILDTHGGSMSSMIACHYGGFDAVCCELDEDYFKSAQARFDAETKQIDIFGAGNE
jgi:site-specific DNA-methyltransferase (adenine-specific)